MTEVLRWYLATVLIGAGGLVPAALLFGRLHSRGVLYARPLALLLVAYAVWLGGAVGAIPYGTPAVLAAVAALWALSAALLHWRPELGDVVRARRHLLLVGEALFLGLFLVIVLVRAQAPAAAFTEKPMDLMLLQAVHGTTSFPPADGWFAGSQVSYYHLGHTTVDVQARLAGVPPGVAFTLGIAMAAALAGVAVFALAGDALALTRRRRPGTLWVAGGVAVTVLLLVATLEGGLEVLAANGLGSAGFWARAGVEGFPPPLATTNGVPDDFWWWWRATRVLPGTITEFPAFSLVLGDLHAHVMALPLAALAVAMALPAFDGATPLTWRVWLRQPASLILGGLLFAGLAMTNSWDAVLFGAVWLGAGAAAFLAVGWGPLGAVFGMLRHLLPAAAIAAMLALPFLGSLEHVPLGVAALASRPSDPLRLALVWLPPLAPSLAAIVLLRPRVERRAFTLALALASLPVVGWLLLAPATGAGEAIGARGAGWLVLPLLVGGAAWTAAAASKAYGDADRGRAAWLALLTAAALIVLATELVFLVDAFGGRLNTVFKFWYGAWLLLAVAAGGAAGDVYERRAFSLALIRGTSPGRSPRAWRRPTEALRQATLAALALVLAVSLLYAPAAAISRAGEGQARGLDATAFLAIEAPAQAEAVAWARANLGAGDVLLEAVGASYEQTNRVSTLSGIPTVLAWPGHQRQWRGDTEALARREADVQAIYEAGASPEALAVAQRYGVTYVLLGIEEQRRYGPDVGDRFAAWPTVFETAGTRIVAVRPEETP